MTTVVLPEDYGYVMMGMVGTVFHCFVQGALVKRYETMSNDWVERNLKEENKQFEAKYGYKIPKGAYPDMTDGKHATKLSYTEWLAYACAQRAHGNYVEGVTTAVVLMGISGLLFPRKTAALAFMYIVGRQLYCSGYRNKGPKARVPGAIVFNLALIGLLTHACYVSYAFTKFGGQQ